MNIIIKQYVTYTVASLLMQWLLIASLFSAAATQYADNKRFQSEYEEVVASIENVSDVFEKSATNFFKNKDINSLDSSEIYFRIWLFADLFNQCAYHYIQLLPLAPTHNLELRVSRLKKKSSYITYFTGTRKKYMPSSEDRKKFKTLKNDAWLLSRFTEHIELNLNGKKIGIQVCD